MRAGALVLVLEGDLQLRAIRLDLAVLQLKIHLHDLGDPEISQGRSRLGDRRRRGERQIDYLIAPSLPAIRRSRPGRGARMKGRSSVSKSREDRRTKRS